MFATRRATGIAATIGKRRFTRQLLVRIPYVGGKCFAFSIVARRCFKNDANCRSRGRCVGNAPGVLVHLRFEQRILLVTEHAAGHCFITKRKTGPMYTDHDRRESDALCTRNRSIG